MFTPERTALAIDKVRHVGDPIAIVIAETYELAKDAAELIMMEIEELPSVTNCANALNEEFQKYGKIILIFALIGKWVIKKKLMKLSKMQKQLLI